jgi:hypothetical protein
MAGRRTAKYPARKQRDANNAHGLWWVSFFIINFSVPRWLGIIQIGFQCELVSFNIFCGEAIP